LKPLLNRLDYPFQPLFQNVQRVRKNQPKPSRFFCPVINLGAMIKDASDEDIIVRLRNEKVYIAAGEHYGLHSRKGIP
jgi:hypothetical protein